MELSEGRPEPRAPAEDDVNRVTSVDGARPRSPLRTQYQRRRRARDRAALSPRPSLRQRSDSPITSSSRTQPPPRFPPDLARPPTRRRHAGELLNQQRGVREHVARGLSVRRRTGRPEQPQRRARRRAQPRSQFQRRPVVLRAAERRDDLRLRPERQSRPVASDEHGHVARCRGQTAPTSPRGTPSPSSGRRPSSNTRSTSSVCDSRPRSLPGWAELTATAREATP